MVASLLQPVVGQQVHKMGFATGWTSGSVQNTCATFIPDYPAPIVRLRQALASHNSAGGDSGAPVFTWGGSGSLITVVGLHIGALGTRGVYTPWLYVSLELEDETGPWQIAY
jgi:hypothetical protein